LPIMAGQRKNGNCAKLSALHRMKENGPDQQGIFSHCSFAAQYQGHGCVMDAITVWPSTGRESASRAKAVMMTLLVNTGDGEPVMSQKIVLAFPAPGTSYCVLDPVKASRCTPHRHRGGRAKGKNCQAPCHRAAQHHEFSAAERSGMNSSFRWCGAMPACWGNTHCCARTDT
jgi:hypothetical protein